MSATCVTPNGAGAVCGRPSLGPGPLGGQLPCREHSIEDALHQAERCHAAAAAERAREQPRHEEAVAWDRLAVAAERDVVELKAGAP